MPHSCSEMAAAGFVASMGHYTGFCPCRASEAVGCSPGSGAECCTCTVFRKDVSCGQGAARGGQGGAEAGRSISQHLGSFPAKPLPWFISNWEKGPSVAQPVEDASSLWEEGV